MQYYLYKLKFPYGVHFGADKTGTSLDKISQNCHCDTLYSAICHEVIKLYGEEGEEGLKKFHDKTVEGNFLFSDLLPYTPDNLLIPKPILFVEKSEDRQTGDSVLKKKMKKLQFIPVDKIQEFFDGTVENIDFAENVLYEKNAVARDGNPDNNGLHSVAVTRFKEGCGLYFVVKMDESKKEWFDKVMNSLSLSGIGGKRTSGYGRFEIEEVNKKAEGIVLDKNSKIPSEAVMAKLLSAEGDYYLSLSAFCPKKDEISKLKSGYYTLIQRQGFVQSATYNTEKPLKKLPITMVNAGSCFKEKFDGDVVDVKKDGSHPVYRYGKPIMIGINL